MGLTEDIDYEDEQEDNRITSGMVQDETSDLAGLNLLSSVTNHPQPTDDSERPQVAHQLMQEPDEGGSSHVTVLGRRPRSSSEALEKENLAPAQKRQYSQFASELCAKKHLTSNVTAEIVEYSQRPTHELLIVVLVSAASREAQATATAMNAYLRSDEFKENVIEKVQAIILDPRLPCYKNGLKARCLRHIHLNPGVYRIPADIAEIVETRAFRVVVSRTLSRFRNSLKAKLAVSWSKKRDIISTVKDLLPTKMEVVDQMWGRWAYVVSSRLTCTGKTRFDEISESWQAIIRDEFTAKVEKREAKAGEFWDYVDKALQDRRDKFANLPEDERAKKISKAFEIALKNHKKQFKPSKKFQLKPNVPVWQEDVACAIDEMDGYMADDLDLENDGEEETVDDNDDA